MAFGLQGCAKYLSRIVRTSVIKISKCFEYFAQNVNFSDVLLKDYSLEDGHKYNESNYPLNGSLDWTNIALLDEVVISILDKI